MWPLVPVTQALWGGTGVPGALWPVYLAKTMNFKFSESLRLFSPNEYIVDDDGDWIYDPCPAETLLISL